MEGPHLLAPNAQPVTSPAHRALRPTRRHGPYEYVVRCEPGTCRCGCPSIEFRAEPRIGLQVRVNAVVDGSDDGLFLYTVGGHLGGIEWAGVSDNVPAEFPDPVLLKIAPA